MQGKQQIASKTLHPEGGYYQHGNGQSVPVLNLRKNPCALLRLLMFLVAVFAPREKDAIVQETLFRAYFYYSDLFRLHLYPHKNEEVSDKLNKLCG